MKGNEEIEKFEKYNQKSIRIAYNSLCVHVYGGIFAYYCVWTYKCMCV